MGVAPAEAEAVPVPAPKAVGRTRESGRGGLSPSLVEADAPSRMRPS